MWTYYVNSRVIYAIVGGVTNKHQVSLWVVHSRTMARLFTLSVQFTEWILMIIFIGMIMVCKQ